MPLKAIAESVTAYGREAIELKMNGIERDFPMPDSLTKGGNMRPIVIGGDTDSIFIVFPNCDTPALAIDISKRAADWINETYFRRPMKTVFEKCYYPALYIAQKRYFGVYWDQPDKPVQVPNPGKEGETWAKLDTKGAENVRRDNCLIVSESAGMVPRFLLEKRDPAAALIYMAGLVEDLRTGQVDKSRLIISKSLSKPPQDYPIKAAHVQLAERLQRESPATAPRVGERVPYILKPLPPRKDAKISQCAATPREMLEQNLPINVDYYLQMLRKPFERSIEWVVPGAGRKIFDGIPLAKRSTAMTLDQSFGRAPVSARSLAPQGPPGQKNESRTGSEHPPSNRTLEWARSLSRVSAADLDKRVDEYLLQRRKGHKPQRVLNSNSGGNSALFKAGLVRLVDQCVACSARVPDKQPRASNADPCPTCGPQRACDCEDRVGPPALCQRCHSTRFAELRKEAELKCKEASTRNDARWEVCRKCVGSIEDAEPCSFSECENHFARAQSRVDLANSKRELKRFNYRIV